MFLTNHAASDLSPNLGQDIHSLSDAQATAVAAALPDGWSIDRHVTAEEGLGLMISPTGSTALDTVFYVDAEPLGLCLSVMRGDEFEHLGCYGSVPSLTAKIQAMA